MTTDPLPQLVEQTFSIDDLSSSNLTDTNYWLSRLKSVVGVIPGYGGVAAEGIQLWHDYKLNSFFRKFAEYINGIKEIPVVERHKFVEEIQMKSHDNAGHVLLEMVDRLDNIQKEKALAQLSIARIHQFISIEDFFRLSTMLSRIPYVDLIELTNYKEPYYDEGGDTELLYATGALELHTLDANDSNKYILSRLGEKLLKWGFV